MRYLYLLLLLAFVSCDPNRDYGGYQVTAYVPVYVSAKSDTAVSNEAPKATVHPGKIYAYGNYLFQVEQNEGIHIIDNSNPQQAHKILFLKIPAASELAIKSNYLYTNNMDDLVVFDLSNITSPRLVNRINGAFPQISQKYPPFNGVYFECPDPSKGIVVGWEEKLLNETPKCRRN